MFCEFLLVKLCESQFSGKYAESESESGKPCSVTTRISESEVNPRIRFLLRIWSESGEPGSESESVRHERIRLELASRTESEN